ncbi:hypothetical protein QYF36_007582 [Acer negundo]|nr:hypothetical protein QYF36_007582 [Acer negundo]
MEQINVPHVVMLPFPVQGHIRPMIKLAKLLNQAGSQVTFVNTDHNHTRLMSNADLITISSFHDRSPKFLFRSIPVDNAPSLLNSKELMDTLQVVASASCTWTYFHLSKLVEKGDVPFPDGNLDKSITCIPSTMARASALILNTFHEIEAPMISRLNSIFMKIYTIGPVHALHKSRISQSDSSNGAVLEFWHGLVNGGKPFLWVVRSELIVKESGIDPMELEMVTKERGFIVSWAPQEEVLAQPAVGGFLTHSGWNSTLESINAGVSMICWPELADQQVNSRCVSEVWKIGFDMKDTCDRSTVEKLARDLMDSNKREEIMKSTDEFVRLAVDTVKEGGPSYTNLEKLIEDIRSMSPN